MTIEARLGTKRTSSGEEKPAPTAAATATVTSPLDEPLRVKRLSATAKVPTRGSIHAAGYDLYAAQPTSIPARGKGTVELDISIALPQGTYGRVAPRSGLGEFVLKVDRPQSTAKHSIDTGAGVIDYDYRGPVKVILFNFSDTDFSIEVGDRVAQLILEEVRMAPVVEVEELDETIRGEAGFGSTGGFGLADPAGIPA